MSSEESPAQAAVSALPRNATESESHDAVPTTSVTRASDPASTAEESYQTPNSKQREFELNQVRRRFKPKERSDKQGLILDLSLTPTDPDFKPEKFTSLDCVLRVPEEYPASGKPSLIVTNRGLDPATKRILRTRFEEVVSQGDHMSLLRALNLYDRALPSIFAPQPLLSASSAPSANVQPKQQLSLSPEERARCSQVREKEINQLKARFSRDASFVSLKDSQSFVVPVTPAMPGSMPPSLRDITHVVLRVPELYPSVPCTIDIPGVGDPAAEGLRNAFEEHVCKTSKASLISHINFLGVKMHVLAKKAPPKKEVKGKGIEAATAQLSIQEKAPESSAGDSSLSDRPLGLKPQEDELSDKPHLHVIPRPPEWDAKDESHGEESETDESDGQSYSDFAESELEEQDESSVPQMAAAPSGRHIALSFPNMVTSNIELLYIRTLALVVKCERCKETAELRGLTIRDQPNVKPPRTGANCKKCGVHMSIEYRHALMHPGSNRAGYLIAEACTVIDMLPSQFVPTCSECSTTSPDGYVCVRGGNFIAFCKKCHQNMRCSIPELKFLLVSAGESAASRQGRRPKKEVLGIHVGQELPRRGRCSHYAKSYRWFRFSCCQRVFPCDKCHDAATDHPNEHANRMICGFCSREQNYRPEDCGTCHARLTGKATSGFWEGGKGTRDKVRMSRKDPRKYKRRPGNQPTSATKK